jgi:hypothetical protein
MLLVEPRLQRALAEPAQLGDHGEPILTGAMRASFPVVDRLLADVEKLRVFARCEIMLGALSTQAAGGEAQPRSAFFGRSARGRTMTVRDATLQCRHLSLERAQLPA